MRSTIRSIGFKGGVAAAICLIAAACGPRGDAPSEDSGNPVSADREAEMAAEQLASLGGPADAATRALYTGEFQASGALEALGSGEGAWELRLLEDYGDFSRPGLGQDGGVPGERNYRERGMQVTVGPVIVTLKAQECPLPSGDTLPYTAYVLFEGVAYQGCARRGVDEGERPSWASVLPELLPAIDTCLARVTSEPARVTTASALDDGVVSVRLREADGSRRECIAAADGSAVQLFETLSDIDRRTGEGEVEFQRSSGAPEAENCKSVEAATDHNGQPAGWLIRRTC